MAASLLVAFTPGLANTAADVAAPIKEQVAPQAPTGTDEQFATLFADWQSLDKRTHGKVAIPSGMPVREFRLTSQYGFREDPFRGRRANHKGVDMAGPVGTPIYATADGIVGRAQWLGGYGKYIEINHGSEIQSRYGHMSELNVVANQRVKKGEIIGYMGSTGRSTGSHLHYEVRIAGDSVNPTPFMQADDYLIAMKDRRQVALGGPSEAED